MVCLLGTKLGDNPRLWYPEKAVWGEETILDLCSQSFCFILLHEVGMGHFVTIFVTSFQRSALLMVKIYHLSSHIVSVCDIYNSDD